MASKKYAFTPDYAVKPGETLREVIETSGMTLRDFAARTGLTVQSIIRIINGTQPITPDTANRFELVTGTPASLWNNLEKNYQEQLARIAEKERNAKDVEWLKLIPVNELVKRRIIRATKDRAEQVLEVLRFFAVGDVAAWHRIWDAPEVATRRSSCFETCQGSAATWIRLGEIQAGRLVCQPYDKSKFKQALHEIRKLTSAEPSVFVPKLKEICAQCGVALALVKELPKVPWFGASKWLSPEKAMILLNLRGKRDDLFWFAFFHEAGHVINDNKKDLYINSGDKTDPIEVRADEFAADMLIPRKYESEIRMIRSKAEILQIARKLEVSPGIVVGRYQHLTGKYKLFNDLKTRFSWSEQQS